MKSLHVAGESGFELLLIVSEENSLVLHIFVFHALFEEPVEHFVVFMDMIGITGVKHATSEKAS